uniref:DDE Tnp4 domain-containing protein n=1 Tax=Timema cristinae TaxID=61476 RepID=A0A7R9HB05_TIMCR|nr:unnamed protein product [Timema cristinae]
MRILRRNIRDMSNPFEILEIAFQTLFCESRILARDLCGLLRGRLQRTMTSGIPVPIQVTAALCFFAEGVISEEWGRTHLWHCRNLQLEDAYTVYATLFRTSLLIIGLYFLPLLPKEKGYNKGIKLKYVMLQIRDQDLRALNVNARFPGRVHDQFIWRDSTVKVEMKRLHQERIGDFYLLAQAARIIETCVVLHNMICYRIPFNEETMVAEPDVPEANENNVANGGREVRADIVRRYFYR